VSLWSVVRETLRSLLARRAEERELDEELRFHVEEQTAENLRRGMTPAAARAAAAHALGGVERYREEAREARGTRLVEELVRDVGYGLRVLRRTPGVSLVSVLTLALGIGATSAIFSVVKGVLLDPLPYPEPDRLVMIWGRFLPESGFDFPRFVLSPPEYFDYRAQNRSLSDVAALSTLGVTLLLPDGEAVRVRAASATASLAGVLGVAPALGRWFTEEEDRPGGTHVLVLSDGLWRRAFGADPAVLGRMVRMNGEDWQVLGVMPRGFAFPDDRIELYGPAGLDPAATQLRQSHFIVSVGRLAPGATLAAASAEMTTLMAGWKAQYPEIHTGHFLFLRGLLDDVVGGVRRTLLVLFGGVAVVLLIVCANVTSILLARAGARRREVAVRAALGGARSRLARQFLTESTLLAFAGGALGLVLARLGLDVLQATAAGAIPRATHIRIDGGVALFACAVTLTAALLAGTVPALRAASAEPQQALRDGDRSATAGRRRGGLRSTLVVLEVALAVVLVVSAGLLARSFRALHAVDPGFRTDHLLIADLSLPNGDYPDSTHVIAFLEQMRERLAGLPGVQAVSGASAMPFYRTPGNFDFDIEGRSQRTTGQMAASGDCIVAMPGYLEAMGIALLEGRFFEPGDRMGAEPVAVVNRTLARAFFPGESAIGKRIRMAGADSAAWLTIVGVIEDVKNATRERPDFQSWYIPFSQSLYQAGYYERGLTFALRTTGDPARLGPRVREVVRSMDPRLPIIRLETAERLATDSLARPRFTFGLFGLFASLAALIGAIGLYGLLSFNVGERAREIGIRRALGAQTSTVLRLVVRQGLLLTATGLTLGLAAALALTRVMQSSQADAGGAGLLFQTRHTDPLTYLTVTLAMTAVALLATSLPAWRATRLDPLRVLRSD
jgi:predicted permease